VSQHSEAFNYDELRNELRKLHERVAVLELRQARDRAPGNVFKGRGPLAVCFVALVATSLAQTGDPLSIDGSGKVRIAKELRVDGPAELANRLYVSGPVGIGTATPLRPLEINNALRFTNTAKDTNDGVMGTGTFGPGLNIVGINTDSYRKIRLWGEITQAQNDGTNVFGTTSFTGEIRGKPWYSEVYEMSLPGTNNTGSASRSMTRTDRSVCFLTTVSGKFFGKGEAVSIEQAGQYWVLTVNRGPGGADIVARARCIGAP
jgi:hypothetical protein